MYIFSEGEQFRLMKLVPLTIIRESTEKETEATIS